MKSLWMLVLALALISTTACGDDDGDGGGGSDGSSSDSGTTDGGSDGSGDMDAGEMDSGSQDSDSGPVDGDDGGAEDDAGADFSMDLETLCGKAISCSYGFIDMEDCTDNFIGAEDTQCMDEADYFACVEDCLDLACADDDFLDCETECWALQCEL